MGTCTYPQRTVSSERTRTTQKRVTPPFSHLAVVATLVVLSLMVSFPSLVTAETMNTLNTMDDATDMLADFAKYEMEDSTVDLVNAETGAKLSKNSKAAFGDATPFDDADDFDLGTLAATAPRRARARGRMVERLLDAVPNPVPVLRSAAAATRAVRRRVCLLSSSFLFPPLRPSPPGLFPLSPAPVVPPRFPSWPPIPFATLVPPYLA
jgi:hypothetical protein